MTQAHLAATGAPGTPVAGMPRTPIAGTEYQPGACNIGPAEIARRRRSGHVALAVTIVVLASLIAIGAPPLARLVAVLPAAAAGSGYLQAWLKFCAGFGSRGVFNFGPLGQTQLVASVADDDARRKDRSRSLQIGLASLGIGLAVGIVAVLLPL